MSAPLPAAFCWTRFGTEAGEPIERILERKEAERRSGGGVFFWGIGNSVAPGIAELVRRVERPELLFSPIKGRPRPVDVSPGAVVRWTAGTDLEGGRFELPASARVTSRYDSISRPHYALVCSSEQPLHFAELGRVSFGSLRNLVSGNPLGASQVTAVVSLVDDNERAGSSEYAVTLRAQLAAPYFLRLREPILTNLQERLEAVHGDELIDLTFPVTFGPND